MSERWATWKVGEKKEERVIFYGIFKTALKIAKMRGLNTIKDMSPGGKTIKIMR